MSFEKIAIIGAGTMGSGIAHVFARSGFQVLLHDVDQSPLDHALGRIRANLGRKRPKANSSPLNSSLRLNGLCSQQGSRILP